MARGQQLNVKLIERLKEPGKYSDGRNLYLHVSKSGSRSWLFIYRRLGRDRMRGLGSYRCGSAWKKDPGSGVIGVEKGPLIPVV